MASTGGTAYVLHIDHLDPKDAKRPWLSKTREEDKVGDFGESRGLNPQKRVLSWAWTIRTDCAERKACAKRWYSFQHPLDFNVDLLINTLFRKAAGHITGSPASTFALGQFQHSTKFDDLLQSYDTT
ncbi:hypothetical protein E4U46_000864 [Claviceps purpurea]|nr:hypothetical protein E4U46_000864 [Claviceps purpurea]